MNDKIKELESKIERMKSDMEVIVKSYNDLMGEVKKESEIKPVFGGNHMCDFLGVAYNVNELLSDDARKVATSAGLTFDSDELAIEDHERKKARKYVIEAINQANRGDNGFNRDIDNFLLEYNHIGEKFDINSYVFVQSNDDYEYIRTEAAAQELLKDDKFVNAYKLMKGIK